MEALKDGNYADAIDFFKEALLVNPSAQDSLNFLNAIKRLQQGRVSIVEFEERTHSLEREAYYTLIKREQDEAVARIEKLAEIEGGSFQEEPPLVKAPDKEGDFSSAENLAHQKQQETEKGLDFLELMAEQKSQAITEAGPSSEESSLLEKKKKREAFIADALLSYESSLSVKKSLAQKPPVEKPPIKKLLPQESLSGKPSQSPQTNLMPSKEAVKAKTSDSLLTKADTIDLDDRLWDVAQKPKLHIDMGTSMVLRGKDIERYLVISPGFIRVDRLDRDHIVLTAEKRGKTVLLIWETHGRWSFNVEAVFPVQKATAAEQNVWSRDSDPFRFTYSADWTNYYSNEGSDEFERRTLTFMQRMMLEGESPYGYFDTSVVFDKLDDTTEATGYSVGLTDGRIGPFSDFSLRGFDAKKTFSPLTLSSKYFRGILYDQNLFNKNFSYTFLTGRDRSAYGYLTPELMNKQDFFVTGARMQLFPEGKHRYAFNYTEGKGTDQPSNLKSTAMSVETFQEFGNLDLSAELAYAQKDYASIAAMEYAISPEMDVAVNFRNIDKDYTMVTSNVSGQGEVGSILSFSWRPEDFNVDSALDLYRNRLIPNPFNDDAYNYDWSTSIRKIINDSSSLSSNIYYLYTPGVLSPARNFRIYNMYSKSFRIAESRMLSAFIGQSYQRSRYDYSPASEFDRLGASAGIRIPFFESLAYYCNYEHFWVEEMLTQNHIQPHVVTTGFNYSKSITDHITGNLDLSYRREEGTQSPLSFLAGEDSAGFAAGITYRPSSDLDFYLDSSGRRIWPKDASREEYFEADVRCGVRLGWELPFHWNPQGYVAGVVFKDMNGNGKQDLEEEGIAGVTLQVGKEQVTTGANGRYLVQVRARSVQVGLDFNTLPQGYILTTALYQNVEIVPQGTVKANFGLTTQSGIYGVVYYDANGNKKPDERDEFLPGVKIILDGKDEIFTDFEGAYSFSGIAPGKHEISFDVNSIPVEYIPLVKLKNEIEVQEGTTYIFHILVKKQ